MNRNTQEHIEAAIGAVVIFACLYFAMCL